MFNYNPNQELLDYLGTAMQEFPAAQADLIDLEIKQQFGQYNQDLSDEESDDYTLKLTR